VYSKQAIKKLFGRGAVERIKARHRGGVSGQKGSRFEDFFAVFRLAEELSHCYGGGTARFKNARRAIVRAQVFAIIDDIAVEIKTPRINEHYQMKNVGRLTWESIENDFLCQKRLCRKTKVKSKLYLVVPTWALKSKLEGAQTSKASKCGIVIVFPYKKMPILVQTHQAFRDALIKLSPFSKHDAENEKLLSLATFLCGNWVTANNKISVENLARAMEGAPGAFCRPLKGNKKMPSDVARILSEIPGFSGL